MKNLDLYHDEVVDGVEAVEKFKHNKYDLILMDENMSNLSGIGATKITLELEKEQNLKHTPIISLTANAIKGDKERFIDAGMDDYLSKPVNLGVLTEMLYKYLV